MLRFNKRTLATLLSTAATCTVLLAVTGVDGAWARFYGAFHAENGMTLQGTGVWKTYDPKVTQKNPGDSNDSGSTYVDAQGYNAIVLYSNTATATKTTPLRITRDAYHSPGATLGVRLRTNSCGVTAPGYARIEVTYNNQLAVLLVNSVNYYGTYNTRIPADLSAAGSQVKVRLTNAAGVGCTRAVYLDRAGTMNLSESGMW